MNNEAFKQFANQDFKSFSDALFSLSAFEFNLIATILGFAITPTLTTNQQNSLGNFFALIGQVLMTANAQNITLAAEKARYTNLKKGFQTNSQSDEILLIKEELLRMFDNFYNNNN